MAEQKFASFAPEDMKEGGNLWDNVDAKITGFKFTREAPDNYTVEGSPIFAKVDFEIAGTTPIEERRVDNSYSLGAAAGENFDVSEDGYKLIPKSEDAQANKGSKFGTFVMALINEGLPKTVAQVGDFSKLIGLVGHFKRVPDKERTFADDKRKNKSKFPPATLVCTKVIALPGQAGSTTGSSTAAAVADAGEFNLDATTVDYLTGLLKAKGKPIQRSQLVLLISQAAVKDANRAVIAKRAAEEDLLKNLNEIGIVKYEPDVKGQPVSLPAAA